MDTQMSSSGSNNIWRTTSICCVANTDSLSHETLTSRITDPRREWMIDWPSPYSDSFADAKIAVSGGREVAVHQCVLSARSPYFEALFHGTEGGVRLELGDLAKDVDVSFDALVAVLAYLYSGRVRPLPEGVCVCVDDECSHVACRPAVDFMVEVLYASFIFQISELVALYQRHLLYVLDKVVADDLVVVLSVAHICSTSCERLFLRCIENIVRSDVDIITLEKALPQQIVKQIIDSHVEIGFHGPESSGFLDKHVRRIHMALDSDDIELVRMLLREWHTTLDDACALHYAVAYCDVQTTMELLDLALADVNHRNPRGYTVLHVAAMRKEPKIIVSLLTRGAQLADVTLEGRKALQISKRFTRAVDYHKSTAEGKLSPKDRLCIEILEQAERADPLPGEASVSLAMAVDDLQMKLLYLENRVGLTMLLFPMEAEVAINIAKLDVISEFPLAGIISKNLAGAQSRTMDLNEAPVKIKEEHLIRLRVLSKTVELGKQFFPFCSEVVNKIMDTDD